MKQSANMQVLPPLVQSRIPHLAHLITARRSQSQQHIWCHSGSTRNSPEHAKRRSGGQNTLRPSRENLHLRPCQRLTTPSPYSGSAASLPRTKPSLPRVIARTYTSSAGRKSSSNTQHLPHRLIYRPAAESTEIPQHNRQGRSDILFYSIAFTFASALGGYITFVYVSHSKAVVAYNSQEASKHIQQNADVSNRYDNLGRDYDTEVDMAEWTMRMGPKRRRVCGEAHGKVLEVGVGTGRNLEHYHLSDSDDANTGSAGMETYGSQAEIQSLAFLDKSPAMLAAARNKWTEFFAPSKSIGHRQPPAQRERWTDPKRVQWLLGDVSVRGAVNRPPGGYDCVVETMGLCSFADPVLALRVLGDLVSQPGERAADDKGGKILLLEHGRGYYDWINRILDNGAPMHADHYGCWWNRDIKSIVEHSGLVVERMRRYHLGTTWEVVLRPKAKNAL